MKLKYILFSLQQYIYVFKILITSISLVFFVSSCSIGGKSNPSRFYVLDSSIDSVATGNLNNLSMGIGPFTFPGYINRPQIVTKTETAELEIAEYDRWAEPIDGMFIRTLTSNIEALTSSNYIVSHPWSRQATLDYRVKAKVIKFENNTKGNALLIVQWGIYKQDDETAVKTNYSEFTASAKDTSYTARVAALNDTLAQFAKEIVDHID